MTTLAEDLLGYLSRKGCAMTDELVKIDAAIETLQGLG